MVFLFVFIPAIGDYDVDQHGPYTGVVVFSLFRFLFWLGSLQRTINQTTDSTHLRLNHPSEISLNLKVFIFGAPSLFE